MASEYKLKGITALPQNIGDKVEAEVEGLEGAKVLLVNTEGTVQALGAKCTHYGAPLIKGVVTKDGRITCPWHGACFSAKTGDIEDAPALDPLPTFKVSERNGSVYVTGEPAVLKAGRRKPRFKCSPSTDNTKPQDGGVVVVGGGSATIGLVEELRHKGYAGSITVISQEGYLPIDRPKLSKALIGDPAKIALRSQEWYDEGSVKFVYDEVTDVQVSDKQVRTAGGRTLSYGKLVLATGGTANLLPLDGLDGSLKNVFTIRSAENAEAISAAIGSKGKKIVIIGSSFIGLEVANATAADNTVCVIGREQVPLGKILGPAVGAGIQKGLEAKGVKFYLSASTKRAVASSESPSAVGSVELEDGTSLPADLVILGVGVKPATKFLEGNSTFSLESDGSLATNGFYQVKGLDNVYALGDIAKAPYRGPGGTGAPTRIEHWNVAQNSGRIAAGHIAGVAGPEPEVFIPVFWSALSAQLRYCGNTSAGFDDIVIQGSPLEGAFVAYYTKGDTVVAVATMGRDPVMVQSAELMRLGKMPSKKELEGGLDLLTVGAP
ncbi:Apoptosis-inducing factor 1 [Ceratocystis lukuohia]|uniref:Apoptosis-inducing factor 1 n=1 Tax=Ceratocystis lukuohia TaxID=2019550 RepID=A0ABR4MRY0_9PEZI